MTRYLVTLFFGGLLLPSYTFGAGIGFTPSGISFPDGTFQAAAALPPLPPGMAWVATSGGDYTSPVAAMNDLSAWCKLVNNAVPQGSACTLLIAPGSYNLGTEQLVMHADVDIVGMGVKTTILYGYAGSSVWDESVALILGAARATLRNLTVANYNTYVSQYSAAIYNDGAGFHVDHADVNASGSFRTFGIFNNGVDASYTDINVLGSGVSIPTGKFCSGMHIQGAGNVAISRAKIVASGCDTDSTAIQNNGGNLRLTNVDASAICAGVSCAYGVWNSSVVGGVVTILNSRLEGAMHSLKIYSASDRIVNTKLDGPVRDDQSASIQCRGTYDNDLVKVDC